MNPEYPNARRNYWRVDESRITPKMLRRHFGGTLGVMTDSPVRSKYQPTTKEKTVNPKEISPELEKRPVKFTSSFSIESLLRKDPDTRSTHHTTQQADAPQDVKLSPDSYVYSLHMKFEVNDFEPPVTDFPEGGIHRLSQCGRQTYHDLYDPMRNGYTHPAERLAKRARVSTPLALFFGAGVGPYFNYEHMVALKRWSLGTKTFDSRNF